MMVKFGTVITLKNLVFIVVCWLGKAAYAALLSFIERRCKLLLQFTYAGFFGGDNRQYSNVQFFRQALHIDADALLLCHIKHV